MGDWLKLEGQVVTLLRKRGWTVGLWELHTWRQALLEIPATDYTIDSLIAEPQLSWDTKAVIVCDTLARFKKTARFDENPYRYADRESDPLDALAKACSQYPDYGTDIAAACDTISRFVSFGIAEDWILPHIGEEAAFYQLWRLRLANMELIRDLAFLSRLRSRVRGGLEVNVFSTKSEWVDGLQLNGGELTAELRDALGCPHFESTALLELRFADSVVRRHGVFKKPTFADAGGYPPFLPSTVADETGFARHLAPKETENIRGGPEIWHGDLPTRTAVAVRYLPPPTVPLKTGIWADFLENRATRD